ncbi:DUF2637 domain-containing protein [Cellulosimicrobium sp. Marseille-Q4280]|uniref:DUF2637 domain-containing protein n=1 Tax=Cellulosimicrobium sp. Marseille-Q4280 TaxID=2937992 RepID=UPI00203BF54F|nr:DUF2637 domain-containing protein [Cellulosimicrobium sp. Marseille-Q4280]
MASATTRKQQAPISRAVVNSALAGTLVLAAGAFALSFAALTDLAEMAGVPSTLAWIWPLVVDGMVVVATMAIVALAGHGTRALIYPWTLLGGGAAVSVWANAAHAILAADGAVPAAVSALVAAVPPVALLAVTHLSVVLIQRSAEPAKKPGKRRAADAEPRTTRAARAEAASEPVAEPAPAAPALRSVPVHRTQDEPAPVRATRELAGIGALPGAREFAESV